MKHLLVAIIVAMPMTVQTMQGDDECIIQLVPSELLSHITKQIPANQVMKACGALKCACKLFETFFTPGFEKAVIDSYGTQIDLYTLIQSGKLRLLMHLRQLGCCGLDMNSQNARLLDGVYAVIHGLGSKKMSLEKKIAGYSLATPVEIKEANLELQKLNQDIDASTQLSNKLALAIHQPLKHRHIQGRVMTLATVSEWARTDQIAGPNRLTEYGPWIAGAIVIPVVMAIIGYYSALYALS